MWRTAADLSASSNWSASRQSLVVGWTLGSSCQSSLAVGLERRPLGPVARPLRLVDPYWGRRGCTDPYHHGKTIATDVLRDGAPCPTGQGGAACGQIWGRHGARSVAGRGGFPTVEGAIPPPPYRSCRDLPPRQQRHRPCPPGLVPVGWLESSGVSKFH